MCLDLKYVHLVELAQLDEQRALLMRQLLALGAKLKLGLDDLGGRQGALTFLFDVGRCGGAADFVPVLEREGVSCLEFGPVCLDRIFDLLDLVIGILWHAHFEFKRC